MRTKNNKRARYLVGNRFGAGPAKAFYLVVTL
jgi:hypothetical protein